MGDVREQNQGWIGDTYSFALLAFHDDTLLSKTGTLAGVGYKVFIAANVCRQRFWIGGYALEPW